MTAEYFPQTVGERPFFMISGKTRIGKSGIKLITLSPSCHSGSALVVASGAQISPASGALERNFAIKGRFASLAWSEQDASASERSKSVKSSGRFH